MTTRKAKAKAKTRKRAKPAGRIGRAGQRRTNFEVLREAHLLSREFDSLEPEQKARLESLSPEELKAIIAVKQKLTVTVKPLGGPFCCGF